LLAELNSRFLDQGLFDDERTGLDQIVWSNRSIHEFCLANYFAERARLDEEYLLWDWIYIADQSSTDKYYQFWQFLCEMPKKRRNPTTWLRAVGMLYQRSIVSAAAESSAATSSLRYAKRSNEMIYRSWSDLQAYQTDRAADVRTKATQILKTWQSEFEETCIGDENLGVIASEQIADFLQVQPTVSRDHPFRMGTTADRQIPAEWRQLCRSTYLEYLADGSALTRHYDEHYLGRTGENLRAVQEPLVRAALSAKDETGFYQAYFSLHNSVEFSVKDLPEFCVSRRSVSNSAYRLFDPTWGETSRFGDRYSEVSGTPESPAIYLSFYDSWVYSRWLRTDEYEFRLLYEDEWEYCAKLGFSDSEWWHDFWFDESYDESQHKELLNSEERGLGRVLPAVECVSSLGSKAIDSTGVGLLGFQGNHWVWCEDIYRLQYVGRNVTDSEACDAGSSRVLRGGSWGYDAVSCRCSSRLSNGPAFQSLDAGCRLVRFS